MITLIKKNVGVFKESLNMSIAVEGDDASVIRRGSPFHTVSLLNQ